MNHIKWAKITLARKDQDLRKLVTLGVSNALALSQKPKVTKLQEQELGIKDVGVSAALAL